MYGHNSVVHRQWRNLSKLTATAVTGAVGPGVQQGNDSEVIWDMAVDWDNKFTTQGQVEVIANRLPVVEEMVPDKIVPALDNETFRAALALLH